MSKTCYYNHCCKCGEDECEQCDNYHPVGREAEDNYVDSIIERERIAFRAEWFLYNDYFFT